MSWVKFKDTSVNLDHVIAIDKREDKLEIFFVMNPSISKKEISFTTEKDCIEAFNVINRFLGAKK